jgi:hypothetical protein
MAHWNRDRCLNQDGTPADQEPPFTGEQVIVAWKAAAPVAAVVVRTETIDAPMYTAVYRMEIQGWQVHVLADVHRGVGGALAHGNAWVPGWKTEPTEKRGFPLQDAKFVLDDVPDTDKAPDWVGPSQRVNVNAVPVVQPAPAPQAPPAEPTFGPAWKGKTWQSAETPQAATVTAPAPALDPQYQHVNNGNLHGQWSWPRRLP